MGESTLLFFVVYLFFFWGGVVVRSRERGNTDQDFIVCSNDHPWEERRDTVTQHILKTSVTSTLPEGSPIYSCVSWIAVYISSVPNQPQSRSLPWKLRPPLWCDSQRFNKQIPVYDNTLNNLCSFSLFIILDPSHLPVLHWSISIGQNRTTLLAAQTVSIWLMSATAEADLVPRRLLDDAERARADQEAKLVNAGNSIVSFKVTMCA